MLCFSLSSKLLASPTTTVLNDICKDSISLLMVVRGFHQNSNHGDIFPPHGPRTGVEILPRLALFCFISTFCYNTAFITWLLSPSGSDYLEGELVASDGESFQVTEVGEDGNHYRGGKTNLARNRNGETSKLGSDHQGCNTGNLGHDRTLTLCVSYGLCICIFHLLACVDYWRL